MSRPYRSSGPNNIIIGILFLTLLIAASFIIFKWIFRVLAMAAPVLIILAILIRYKTPLRFVQRIWGIFKDNWFLGIMAILLTAFAFPFVSLYLFVRSIVDRRLVQASREYDKRRRGEYVEHEELESRIRE